MNTIEIPQRGIIREVPACWDEMTPHHIKTIFRLFEQYQHRQMTEVDFFVRTLYCLLVIHRRWTTVFLERILENKYSRRDENVVHLCEMLLPFIVAETETGRVLTFDSVRNFFPQIRLRRQMLVGPCDLLTDLSFAEFRFACTEMSDYFASREQHTLNRLIACLYRPVDDTGHRRDTFVPDRLDEMAGYAGMLPSWQKGFILMWFSNCVNHIQNKDICINGRTVSFSCLFNARDDDRADGSRLGWVSVLYSLASDGVFGDAEKTDRANLFDVLCLLYDNFQKNERK